MRALAGLAFAALLVAQEQAPSGLVRGTLEGWSGTPAGGDLRIRVAGGRVLACGYNDKTYMERERLRIAPTSLKDGDSLEMVTDTWYGRCYARTLHVMPPPLQPTNPAQRPGLHPLRPLPDSILPRGNLTVTGIILKLAPESMLLRTRSAGLTTVLLRYDTKFAERGRMVESSELRVNTQVSIRAGRNLEGDIEAYQVVWGEILPAR